MNSMKKYISLVSVILLASCSAPKYTYHFDHYDYTSKKNQVAVAQNDVHDQFPTTPDQTTLVASADDAHVYVAETAPNLVTQNEKAVKKINALSNEEKRELKKELKKYVKEVKKNPSAEASNSAKALENDVKLAAIFGAVGIVFLIIGGEVFYVLGALALLVGLYFFIRWLIHQ
jgi:hypothetical protein